MQEKNNTQKMALSGILISISVILGTFSIPIGAARISPIQHFVNVIGAITLGPIYALLNAFATSLLRNILGTGSFLAFPGSMVGALLAGILYKKFRRTGAAVIGEMLGTGIFGALLAHPVASMVLGKDTAFFAYIIPFMMSCSTGAFIAYFFLKIPGIKKIITKQKIST